MSQGYEIAGEDPYRWLEDVTGTAALDWFWARNDVTLGALSGGPRFASLRAEAREVLDADDRIPFVRRRGEYLYNFWQDAEHPKGLWRRTTLEEYRRDRPGWEILLDVDALAAQEGENWVWQGAAALRPGGYRQALVHLSRGGADASVVREFDVAAHSFAEGGFHVAEAKTDAGWIDAGRIYVVADFGPGSLTSSAGDGWRCKRVLRIALTDGAWVPRAQAGREPTVSAWNLAQRGDWPMSADQRLADLGLTLPSPPKPIGNYVPFRLAGNLLFLSGVGPRHADEKMVIGKVGADLTVEQGYEAAKLCGLNLLVNMIAAVGTLERVDTVLKVLGMVNAVPDFTQHPEVINGCTDLLVQVLGEGGRPARSAVGMSSLPRNIAVEVEAVVLVRGA